MRVAIRADASLQIGTGHVMRCLALADELRRRGVQVRFFCREHPGNMIPLLRGAGYATSVLPAPKATARIQPMREGPAGWLGVEEADDALDTLSALGDFDPDWFVVDHYALGLTWERMIRSKAARVLVIDDLADRPHECDCLLDQNYHEEADARYDRRIADGCKRLLGPRYALLRPEFAYARQRANVRDGTVRRVLIFFGGADASNESVKAIEAIQQLGRRDLELDVVIGGANPRRDEIMQAYAGSNTVRLHTQVADMASLMAAADLAVGAGGHSTWERLCVGLPAIVISVSTNQYEGSRAVARAGCILHLGDRRQVTPALLRSAVEVACSCPELLSSLRARGLGLVDGTGVRRVADLLLNSAVALRRATASDCSRLHTWRNSEDVRRYSGNPAAIPYQQHVEWCAKVLANSDQALLIGEIDHAAVGVLRYDRQGDQAEVSIYLVPGNQGRGFGSALLESGTRWIKEHWSAVRKIHARVRPENVASIRAFERAGFRQASCTYVNEVRE